MKDVTYKELFFNKKIMFTLFLGLFSFFVNHHASSHTDWVESFFSLFLYPKIKLFVGFFPSIFPFSVFEIGVFLAVIVLIIHVIYSIKKFKKRVSTKKLIGKILVNLISLSCIIYFIFTFTCGLNYHRYTFSHYSNYEVNDADIYNTDELEELSLALVDKLNSTQLVFEDKNFYSYGDDSIKAIHNLSEEYPIFGQTKYSKPKPLLSSELFSKLGIGGIFIPFTFESNINADIPNFLIPTTMTHELAHQAGFMKEDEAHFISYLACINSKNDSLKYSGYFLAFHQTIKILEKEKPKKADKMITKLSDYVKQDYIDYEKYLQTNQGRLQKISNTTNHLYLKSNNQNNGINDYSRMVNLVLAHYRKENKV